MTRRKDRIDRVTNAYLDVCKGIFPGGYPALLRAGASELKTTRELRKVCDRAVARGKPHPNALKLVSDKKLLAFLHYCSKHGKKADTEPEAVFEAWMFDLNQKATQKAIRKQSKHDP